MSSTIDQLQSLVQAKNALDLELSNTDVQFQNLQQHTSRYSRLVDEQYVLHREMREITNEIKNKSSNHSQTIISALEIKKSDMVLLDNTICLELTSILPYIAQYNILSRERSVLHQKVRQLETDIKKIQMRPLYLEYLEDENNWNTSEDHQIVSSILDGTSTVDLYEFCNRNHQEQLLSNGYFATDRPYVGCEGDCEGWDTSEKRCQCGNYKGYRWEDECEKFDDILNFDLTSTVPLGHVSKNW
jgi:hypothetical protein